MKHILQLDNLTLNNQSELHILAANDKQSDDSIDFLSRTRHICFFATITVIVIGLLGNCVTIFVFSQKRFRINSSNIYLLCLAIIDSVFLIVHIFEDLIREYEEIFQELNEFNDGMSQMMYALNITDRFELACTLINFLRYFLRFVSAYIIVAFTIQRLILIFLPLNNKLKTKRSAWLVFWTVIMASFFLNIWTPFLFSVEKNEDKRCDVVKEKSNLYFLITIVYTTLIMLVPIVVVFVCNFLIIYRIKKADTKRVELQIKKSITRSNRHDTSVIMKIKRQSAHLKLKPYYLPSKQIINNVCSKNVEDSKKLTKTLILISFSYAILNLPYLVSWCFFFYQSELNDADASKKNYLFSAVQISKVLFILNYGLKFFIYCVTGRSFLNQLCYLSSTFFFLLV